MSDSPLQRQRITINGIVQGVGFRPFVYRLATNSELAGFVTNDTAGVTIEIEGPRDSITQFRKHLTESPPPLAKIDRCDTVDMEPSGEIGFTITASRAAAVAATLIPPDSAVCDDCVRELFDPGDRRYRYPFINCT
ncbi:MAG: acylphosphatase, partial [Bacteroidetes bacterium]|nr:acylphosphatase [Bacteroidota bacterium]